MLQPPRNAHFEYRNEPKKQYLVGILGRLRNDTGNYLDYINRHLQSTGEAIGFWGSLRLIMPVIEAVSSTNNETPISLLSRLRIKTPNLVWILYRHSLMHNDLLQHGKFDGVEATWGVSTHGLNHVVQAEVIGIDTLTLYNDLVSYLEDEISKCSSADTVQVIIGVIWDNPGEVIKNEFKILTP